MENTSLTVCTFPQGGNLSSYIQLYTAFLISGIIHTNPSDLRPPYFFASQALAITFEEAVTALATRAGYYSPTKMQKILGYMSVLCWFTYSIPGYMDSLIEWELLGASFDVGIISGILRNFGPVDY